MTNSSVFSLAIWAAGGVEFRLHFFCFKVVLRGILSRKCIVLQLLSRINDATPPLQSLSVTFSSFKTKLFANFFIIYSQLLSSSGYHWHWRQIDSHCRWFRWPIDLKIVANVEKFCAQIWLSLTNNLHQNIDPCIIRPSCTISRVNLLYCYKNTDALPLQHPPIWDSSADIPSSPTMIVWTNRIRLILYLALFSHTYILYCIRLQYKAHRILLSLVSATTYPMVLQPKSSTYALCIFPILVASLWRNILRLGEHSVPLNPYCHTHLYIWK